MSLNILRGNRDMILYFMWLQVQKNDLILINNLSKEGGKIKMS